MKVVPIFLLLTVMAVTVLSAPVKEEKPPPKKPQPKPKPKPKPEPEIDDCDKEEPKPKHVHHPIHEDIDVHHPSHEDIGEKIKEFFLHLKKPSPPDISEIKDKFKHLFHDVDFPDELEEHLEEFFEGSKKAHKGHVSHFFDGFKNIENFFKDCVEVCVKEIKALNIIEKFDEFFMGIKKIEFPKLDFGKIKFEDIFAEIKIEEPIKFFKKHFAIYDED